MNQIEKFIDGFAKDQNIDYKAMSCALLCSDMSMYKIWENEQDPEGLVEWGTITYPDGLIEHHSSRFADADGYPRDLLFRNYISKLINK